MPSCDDELEAECDDKGRENIKIENLRILKTIGTGGRSICNVYTGCPKKKDISKFYSVCFTAHLIRNVENSFIHNLKIEINMFDPNTLTFPRDIITFRCKLKVIM